MFQGLTYEDANFPIVCDKCLGETKFLRVTKSSQEKSCKICNRPCTVFRWKILSSKKYAQTSICYTCGKLRNVCQSCICDMNFGLPLYHRESYLKSKIEEGDKKAIQLLNIPESVENRDHFLENKYSVSSNDKIEENTQLRKEILNDIYVKNNIKNYENVEKKYHFPKHSKTKKNISKSPNE
ncbi:hypothetical protein FG379_003305 [Cryptosporidium bovis]|uniref:uncharacterized protein n=1 Tax=Cryptosporidium bovis TaxID=310047 RepID=UPI00351A7F3E|nr:hypothetical protein FG379_003305 [Cryptosporidium bovis]